MLKNTIRWTVAITLIAATTGYAIGGIWILWAYVTAP